MTPSLWLSIVLFPSLAAAGAAPRRFAVIVGNNHSVEAGSDDLQYADDDAVMFDLVLAPHAEQVELLTVLDLESQRLHAAAVARARQPTRAELSRALQRTFSAIHKAGGATELFFVFVGHGGVNDQGEGYVHLQDGVFTRDDLFAEVIAASPADVTHVIVDACNAFSFVGGRGQGRPQGGARRVDALFDSFLVGHQLEAYPNVGVLAATSQDRETHEWSKIRGGVFSHQLRSALSGAADVNEDGKIEYSEVAAFVDAANAGMRASGHGISVFAWPPPMDRRRPLLAPAGVAGLRRVTLGAEVARRLHLETESGLRWADMHSAGQVTLALPADRGFFLRDGKRELFVPAGGDDVLVRNGPSEEYELATRGALDRALEQELFAVPFGRDYYRGWVGGRPQFIGVELDSEPEVAPTSEEIGRWAVGAAYLLGASPVAERKLEHGAEARVSLSLSSALSLEARLQGAFAAVRPGVGIARASIHLGPALAATWWERLRLSGALEVAWALLVIDASPASIDATVPGMSARLGLELRLWQDFWLAAGGSYAVYMVTMDGEEKLRPTPQGHLGLSWRE